jgi:hypothetical protein
MQKRGIPRLFAISLLAATTMTGQMRPLEMLSGNFTAGLSGVVTGTATFRAPTAWPPLPGSPYSGQQVSDSVRTLPDGTHIATSHVIQQEYRDSAGRTRLDRLIMQGPANPPAGVKQLPPPTATISQIVDPALGVAYILDSEDKVAYRVTFEPVPPGSPATLPLRPYPATGPFGQQNVTEDLGTQVIDGVPVQGRRLISTTPAGTRNNDRPIVSITETWQSVEQGLMMLQRTSNENQGTQSALHYLNFSLSVPNPTLFAPPLDYKIVDQPNQFTVTIGPPIQPVNRPALIAPPSVRPAGAGVH